MSKNPSLILAVGFVAGCGAAVVLPLMLPPAHAQTAQRWETLCVNHSLRMRDTGDGTNAPLTELGNRVGREGWEFTSEGTIGTTVVMCFKRPKP